jgi:orotidine-5'-phosphate decarboxylase
MFADKMLKKILEYQNPSVLGLDPDVENMPKFLKDEYFKNITDDNSALTSSAKLIEHFNKAIIDNVCDIIPIVKPQVAYYEMYGIPGMQAFKNTVDYAKSKGMIVITDIKRSDIGTTAKAYSNAHLGRTIINGVPKKIFDADCITVNPYLGTDGIAPFLEDCKNYDKGMFILVKTSNPSSGEFQDILSGDDTIYVKVANKVKEWGSGLIGEMGYSSVGAVVGATYPQQLAELREVMPNTIFLVPGYGAQGGKAEDIKLAYDKNNLGAVVNSSRGLMYAYKSNLWKDKYSEEQFAEATKAEAVRMKKDLWG